jgi:hypothetical protein
MFKPGEEQLFDESIQSRQYATVDQTNNPRYKQLDLSQIVKKSNPPVKIRGTA